MPNESQLADSPVTAPALLRGARSTQTSQVLRLAPAATVSAPRILRIHGYSNPARVRPVIQRAAEAMAEASVALSEPVVAFRRTPVASISGEALELATGHVLHCRAFARSLVGCNDVVPFVLTVGARLGERVIELADAGDLLEAVLLETAGWLCIEDATRQFKGELRAAAMRRAERITSRLGPGYSYKIDGRMWMWPLEEQPALFELLGEPERLPVSLMGSCAMNPKLSRSGMYGVAPLVPTSPAGSTHKERFQ